jgi:hypothetical protein
VVGNSKHKQQKQEYTMKKYILFIIIALCCASGAMAQSMTDNQVIDFVMKETKKGTSQAQIVTKLMQRGVNISQIRRVKKMYDRLQKGSGLGTVSSGSSEKTDDRTRRSNSQTPNGSGNKDKKKGTYGYEDFEDDDN